MCKRRMKIFVFIRAYSGKNGCDQGFAGLQPESGGWIAGMSPLVNYFEIPTART